MIGQLIDHLWQSTVFAAAAALLTLAFRGNRAQVRHWLWLSASLKFLVPFALLMGLGEQLEWAPARRTAEKIAPQAVTFAVVQLSQPFSNSPRPAPAKDWRPAALCAIWACGFAAVAWIRFRAWRRIRAAVRASAPMDIPAGVAGVEIRSVRSAPGLLEPGIVGVIRPVLLLPEGIAERLTPDQLEAVLAHELCHVRRRDNAVAAVHMAVEALFWFHPMVWWIGARLVEERERACDEGVMRLGREPRVYADAILSVCKMYVESPLACVAGVTGADLKKRVEAIMMNRIGQRLTRAKRLLLAAMAVAAVTAPVAIGLLVSAGNAPPIRAQVLGRITPAAQPAKPEVVAMVDAPGNPLAHDETGRRSGRHIAMLFDFGAMTAERRLRAVQTAIDIVRNETTPKDSVAVMTSGMNGPSVVQDFTQDKAALESAIHRASAGDWRQPSAPNARAAMLGNITQILRAVPGTSKGRVLYFSNETQTLYFSGLPAAGLTGNAPAWASGEGILVSSDGHASGAVLGGILGSAPAPAATAQSSSSPRMEQYSAVMAKTQRTPPPDRIRAKYGPPDQIEDRVSDPQRPSQVWRYNYIADFGGNVEFEFPMVNGEAQSPRINWPRPVAAFEGTPEAATSISDSLVRLDPLPGMPASRVIAGLPGRHASLQIYSAKDYRVLTIPLDGLSGTVDVVTRVSSGRRAFGGHSTADASAGQVQMNISLVLDPGPCEYHVLLRERATGRMFGETIKFEVK